MALFGRRRPRDEREGIVAFWAWWAQARDQVDAALEREEDDLRKLHRALTERVHGIHPELAWELTKGRRARRALVLSPEGSPTLRPLTERWLRAGPGPDSTWEYHAARQPDPAAYQGEVPLGGGVFRPGAARFGIDTDTERARVHVSVWHPEFERMEEAIRLQASFLLLDWALGEDDVERWLGEIRVSREEEPDDVTGLRDAVTGLAALFSGDEWTQIEGFDDDARPVLARVKVPFPRLDHPLFDLHGAIGIPFPPGDGGFPSDPDAASLDAMAERLSGRLGSSAALVAVVTKPGLRTLHLYADQNGVVPDQVAAWATQQARPVHPQWRPDPGWEAIRPLY